MRLYAGDTFAHPLWLTPVLVSPQRWSAVFCPYPVMGHLILLISLGPLPQRNMLLYVGLSCSSLVPSIVTFVYDVICWIFVPATCMHCCTVTCRRHWWRASHRRLRICQGMFVATCPLFCSAKCLVHFACSIHH